MKKSRTIYRNGENGVQSKHTRFDILDAHRERVAIKKRHPEPRRKRRMQDRLNSVLDVIRNSQLTPTIREIQDATGIPSSSVAQYYLKRLEKDGWIKRFPGKARGIVLIKQLAPMDGTSVSDGQD